MDNQTLTAQEQADKKRKEYTERTNQQAQRDTEQLVMLTTILTTTYD